MRIKTISLVLLTIFTLLLAGQALSEENSIQWQAHDEGIAAAKKQGKKIVVYFRTGYCQYCIKMEREAFKDDWVIDYLNTNFIPIRVNGTEEDKVVHLYEVEEIPTMVFLTPDMTVLSQMPGYIETEILFYILQYLHTDSYKRMRFKDFVTIMKN